jgi:phosphopantothenoylcysteine decarboxylase/phosphopantothenate--cysteine ligase
MGTLSGKTIVVGVTGGIAAYKACEVVSSLNKLGASVYVIMTRSATALVGPLTFQTLSGHPVLVEMMEPPKMWNVEHIALAERADLVLIAPATANIVAKVANGVCDDMLTTVVSAVTCPVMISPAMNHNMYNNPIYKANESKLRALGYHFIDPAYGRLASGRMGQGRFPDPQLVVAAVTQLLRRQTDYAGIDVLVTAGPTREYFDPVRFISNPSSGKMGFAVARAAAARGATVTVVTGPVDLPDPPGAKVRRVVTAEEMLQAVHEEFRGSGLVVATAAVSDYRPATRAPQKIKKGAGPLAVDLERTPDIISSLAAARGQAILVGFAAESERLVEHAASKLAAKGLDLVVANDITQPDAGFRADTNRAVLVWPDGRTESRDLETKLALADHVLDSVLPLVRQLNP